MHSSHGVACSDGAFATGGQFKHALLLAVSFDSDDRTFVLAAAACHIEDADNWCWFLSKLNLDFPNVAVFVADHDKGMQSARFQNMLTANDIKSGRCIL